MSILGFSTVAGGVLLHGHPADAALVTKAFNGDRSDLTIFNLLITYDDAALSVTVPPFPVAPNPDGITPPQPQKYLCSTTDTSPPYMNGSCYVNTDGRNGSAMPPMPLDPITSPKPYPIPSFTGIPIVSISGTIAPQGGTAYPVIGLAKQGSFEGGYPPLIEHYVSDNLIDPNFLFNPFDPPAGKGVSQGGFVILVEDEDGQFQYQLFSDPRIGDENYGKLAGCGSGDCLQVRPTVAPAPLPALGVAAAFGSFRKLRKFSGLLKTDLAS